MYKSERENEAHNQRSEIDLGSFPKIGLPSEQYLVYIFEKLFLMLPSRWQCRPILGTLCSPSSDQCPPLKGVVSLLCLTPASPEPHTLLDQHPASIGTASQTYWSDSFMGLKVLGRTSYIICGAPVQDENARPLIQKL